MRPSNLKSPLDFIFSSGLVARPAVARSGWIFKALHQAVMRLSIVEVLSECFQVDFGRRYVIGTLLWLGRENLGLEPLKDPFQ